MTYFLREGNHIHCNVPLPMTTAALGGSIEVPTIGGSKARITIPEGTQHNHQLRLKGKGMSILRRDGKFGDMFVHVKVETPVHLTKNNANYWKNWMAW